MAYDIELADRVRAAFVGAGVEAVERSMFGGLAFMVRGHMTVGVLGEDLMARVGPEGYEDALDERFARPMDLTGRPMTGMVLVAPAGLDGAALDAWVRRALTFTTSLPPK